METIDFNYECLYAHNCLRKLHKSPPLSFNEQLCIEAQNYADKIAEKDRIVHSRQEDRNYTGENLAMNMKQFKDYSFSGLGATVAWYSEIKDYDFSKETQLANNPVTGHFTQLIWKNTKEAGFGRAKNSQSNCWYIVGRYQPAGNWSGYFFENVSPLPKSYLWDNVPIVKLYLSELRTLEYTNARRHILDEWKAFFIYGYKNSEYFCDVTETFTTPSGFSYTGKNHFTHDPTKMSRPTFLKIFDEDLSKTYDANNNDNDDSNRTTDQLRNTSKDKSGILCCCLQI